MLGAEGFAKVIHSAVHRNCGWVWEGLDHRLSNGKSHTWHLPTKHGQPHGGWTRFWVGSAGAVIQQIGLAIIYVAFLPETVAFHATALNRNKDLQDDKEGCATGVVGKRDSYVV